ncbi:MAG: glycosyl hydrolase family 95 catalytic domain-containing protein [Bryobacteraceae bacterium]|jgi:alpha-L-fucosidase 2
MARKNKKSFPDLLNRRTFLISSALLTAQSATAAPEAEEHPSGNEVIWFRYPGGDWNTQALHLGNAYFGASLIGDVKQERLALGEKSFWTGSPVDSKGGHYGIIPGGKDAIQQVRRLIVADQIHEADALAQQYLMGNYSSFGSYTTVGNLLVDFDEHEGDSADYLRALDLRRAVATITYRLGGVRYRREYFCSYPARALVMRFSCDRPGKLGFKIQVDPAHKKHAPTVSASAKTGRWALAGQIDDNQLRYQIQMSVRHKGGRLTEDGDALRLAGAQEATVIYTVATEYRFEPPSYRGGNPEAIASGVMNRLQNRGYEELLAGHVADYQRLYRRTSLQLGGGVGAREALPTNERWAYYDKADYADVGLKEMAFHFGKYLLISASRPGALPSGLQGPWANAMTSPWSGNYQININIQLIYMPCGVLGLSECQEPFVEWLRGMVTPGREVARAYYGTEGWIQHTTGNIWGYASPGSSLDWGIFPSGAAWNCRHVWEQYEFTQDRTYLREKAYPLMKEAAQFYLANLMEYRGHLLPAPAISAEHQSSLGYLEPPFQDVEMVGDLFANVVEAAKVLDVDAEFRQRVAATRERMMPLKIGRLGQLQEWVADIDDPNCKHRHFMHLYAVHPGQQIDPLRMPELAAAARVSMNLRGDGENAQRFDPKYNRATWVCSCRHNGSPTDGSIGGNWSRAWKIWIWGRLFDGNRADKIFSQLIGEAGNENLTTYQQRGGANDTRAKPMQLDGSITTPGFMAEMLLQSQFGELHLLPALPDKWLSGSVTGLVARGGARVDVKWNQGKLASAVITLPKGAAVPPVRVAQQSVDPTQDRRIQLRWL